ncbi:hypothetical protein SVIOM342S_01743 [Streptomyces violaceorubidus]
MARLDGHTGRGSSTTESYHVDDLDLARLRGAWQELVTAHEALRLRTGADGTLGVLSTAPADAWIPVLDVPEGADADAVDRAVRADMTHRPFGLGRGAHTDLRVVRAPGRPATCICRPTCSSGTPAASCCSPATCCAGTPTPSVPRPSRPGCPARPGR